jgi:hypothetical protein
LAVFPPDTAFFAKTEEDFMAMFRLRLMLAIALLAGLVLPALSRAQASTATLAGDVRDPSGARIPGATITVTDTLKNTSLSAVSNDLGSYAIPVLNAGMYRVTAELPGFKRFVRDGVQLQVSQFARIDITLEVGESTQLIEVSATTPVLETETSSRGLVVDRP